jgi:hypothetical protein
MTVYILKHQTKSPPKYHTSADCPMVRAYPDSYRAVPSPPSTHSPCRRSGACQKA